ncbi:MAG: hypothetical protein CSA62_12610 [Planctomycetota bacterium]|nr:MAG: hypothetical protein CSA62_12610 [Planctomycetota bacterium]
MTWPWRDLAIVFLLLGAGTLPFVLAPAQIPEELLERRSHATGSNGDLSLRGLELELESLAGKSFRIRAEKALGLEAEFGLLSLGGLRTGLRLKEARLSGAGLRIAAEQVDLKSKEWRLSGAVRVNDEQQRGLLFASELVLDRRIDRIEALGLCVLAPEGQSGGWGGRVTGGLSARLDELLRIRAHD